MYSHLREDLQNAVSAEGITLYWYNCRQWKQFGGNSGFLGALKSLFLPCIRVCTGCIHFLSQQISIKLLLCTRHCTRQEGSREQLDQEWEREAMKILITIICFLFNPQTNPVSSYYYAGSVAEKTEEQRRQLLSQSSYWQELNLDDVTLKLKPLFHLSK